MECWCCLRNVQDFVAEGKTPCERRFGEPFRGPVIPFGAVVEHHPISPRDQSRLPRVGKNILPGIFLAKRGGFWKGNILIADLEDLENWMHQIFTLGESTQKKDQTSRWKEDTTNFENPL